MQVEWLQGQYALAVAGGLGGILVTVVAQRLLGKRGLFTYSVRHDRVAVSGDDAILGSVRVMWNDSPVTSLYASTVELVNDSLNDYDNVEVRVFSTDTIFLTERTEIVGNTRFLNWTREYAQQLFVPPAQVATPEQIDAYGRGRSYLIPTMNRGQTIRFAYLNTLRGGSGPTIWLDVLHKGVKSRYRVPYPETFGVPQPHAALVGALMGLVALFVLVATVDSAVFVGTIAFAFGLIAQAPGALAIRAWRWLRNRLGD